MGDDHDNATSGAHTQGSLRQSLVPFGIGRVVDLQLKGWAYIHA